MNSQRASTAVALFVRNPVPGRVKTRLAADIGDQAACDLYRAMVSDILTAVAVSCLPLYLFHDGSGTELLPHEWQKSAERILPQRGNDLGERMEHAFADCFSAGWQRVLLAGSDIPGLGAPQITAAAEALDRHDAALVPAVDGGYCLIALNATTDRRTLFTGIPWSSADVLQTTVAACATAGLTVAQLETMQDIDTVSDLREYCRRPGALAAATNRYLNTAGFLPQP